MVLQTQTGSLQTYGAVEAAGPGVLVPDAQLLFTGEYSRAGSDLVLTGSDGAKFLVTGYFNTDAPPSLVSPDGAKLPGNVVMSLAGPQFPGQYAQAGDASSGKQAIGKVESSSGSASAVRTDGTTVVLKAGDPVFQGDVVLTGPGSKLGISFVDGTIFSLSADARMVLNSLVYDPDAGQNNSMLFSLVEGTFAFVAGEVAPTGDMKIQTPVATMGIRGTAPTVTIDSETGEVNFSIIADPGDGHVGTYTLYNLDNGLPIGTVSSVGTKWQLTSANGQIIELDKTEADLLNDANAVGQINTIYTQWQNSTQQNPDGPQAGPENNGPPSGGLNTNPQNPDAPNGDGNTGNPGGEGEGDGQNNNQSNNQQSGSPPPPPTNTDNDTPPPPPPPPPPPTETTGPNIINGTEQLDVLNGTSGDDVINALGGNDLIVAKAGDDVVNAGAGNDTIVAGEGEGDDTYNGGAGRDTLSFASTRLGVTIDLANGTASGSEVGNDTFTGIEEFIGGDGGDKFIVTQDGNWLFDGGEGDDTIRIEGDLDIDTENFQGVAENIEVIDLNKDHDNVFTISPDDGETLTFLGGPGDTLNLGRELYTGDEESSTHVEGGWRRVEDVTPPGGPTFAVYKFVDSEGTVRATYQVEPGIDVVLADQTITGTEGDDAGETQLNGTPGDDIINALGGDDVIYSGAGNDIVNAGPGDDVIIGGTGEGDDSYDGGTGDNLLVYDSTEDGITIDLVNGVVTGVEINTDIITNIRNFVGGSGDDTVIIGDGSAFYFDGLGGTDTIRLFGALNIDTVTAEIEADDIEIIDLNDTHANSFTITADDFLGVNEDDTLRFLGGDSDTLNLTSEFYDDYFGGPYALMMGDAVYAFEMGDGEYDAGMGNIQFVVGEWEYVDEFTDEESGLDFDIYDFLDEEGYVRVTAEVQQEIDVVLGETFIGSSDSETLDGTDGGDLIIGLGGSDTLNGDDGNDVLFGDYSSGGMREGAIDEGGQDLTPLALSYLTAGNSLINNLGGDEGFGEGTLNANDDGSTGAIDISSIFGQGGLNFFGANFTSLYINNNGNITFNSSLSSYTPSQIDGGLNNPIIAPYWADVDTRGGPTTPTPGGTSTGSNLVHYDLDANNGVMTITWDDVGYYSRATDPVNAFQVQLIDRGMGDFDVVFRYEDINWTTGRASGGTDGLGGTPARAGYSASDGENFFELPQSGNGEQMLGLEGTTGNTGIQGVYVYEVRNGVIINNDDQLFGGNGNDVLIGGLGHDTLTGGAGFDTFIFNSLNDGLDTITDFGSQDTLDLTGLLEGELDPDNLDAYVQAKTNTAGDTVISVDIDGPGALDPVDIAVLQGIGSGVSIHVTIGDEDAFVTSAAIT